MLDLATRELLEQVATYIYRQESGLELEFPQVEAERLLSSEIADAWRSGLYLASMLPRDEIMDRFYSELHDFVYNMTLGKFRYGFQPETLALECSVSSIQ